MTNKRTRQRILTEADGRWIISHAEATTVYLHPHDDSTVLGWEKISAKTIRELPEFYALDVEAMKLDLMKDGLLKRRADWGSLYNIKLMDFRFEVIERKTNNSDYSPKTIWKELSQLIHCEQDIKNLVILKHQCLPTVLERRLNVKPLSGVMFKIVDMSVTDPDLLDCREEMRELMRQWDDYFPRTAGPAATATPTD